MDPILERIVISLAINFGTDIVVRALPGLAAKYIPQCQVCPELLAWVGGDWRCPHGHLQLAMPVSIAELYSTPGLPTNLG